MPLWTASVTLDKGSDTSGSVSVTWDAAGPDEFSYTERAATSTFDTAAFKARAIAERTAAAAVRASEVTKADAVAAVMNGA